MTGYPEHLAALDDSALVKETDMQVWLSAFAANNPRAPAHERAPLCYTEAVRRGKPWLYQRGFNNAYASAGHQVSDDQRRLAEPWETT